ncbi:GNAT family N-acetyltransferase [Alicyclobacillus tolerans]|uniref:GNAT family N-acetyltransferase n=1 Tax=Alicyclobacillus tolerans TaxID=90970 RepID=UPI003B7E2BEE
MNDHLKIKIFSPNEEEDLRWLNQLWQVEWGGEAMVSRGHVFYLHDLHSVMAKDENGYVGAATYRFDMENNCELMIINALSPASGVGTRLLAAVEQEASRRGCRRVWLITSNDNLDALRFYQKRGYRITAVYPGAIDEARSIKPTIPLKGDHDIEIHDEIELEKRLL